MASATLGPDSPWSHDMSLLQSDHAHSHCHLNGSSVALTVDNQSTPCPTSCEFSFDFMKTLLLLWLTIMLGE